MFKRLRQKIESKRGSKGFLWKALVLGKDFVWMCADKARYNLIDSKRYQKFIVLGTTRTGSNFLISLLDSHSQVKVYYELFFPGYLRNNKHIMKNPIRFLKKNILKRYQDNIKAVGFKLLYHHAQNKVIWRVEEVDIKAIKRLKGVWRFLKYTPGLKIIHLKRRNILKTTLSKKIADQIRKWNSLPPVKEITPVELSYEECSKSFEQIKACEQEYDKFFKNHRKIEVIYEDLEKDYMRETERIQNFLGLRIEKLHSPLKKQNMKPLSEAISNYWELKERFKRTEWAEFFED